MSILAGLDWAAKWHRECTKASRTFATRETTPLSERARQLQLAQWHEDAADFFTQHSRMAREQEVGVMTREVKHFELPNYYDQDFIKEKISELEPQGWALLRICTDDRKDTGIFGFVVFEREVRP
jgi:hypothetical protein